MTYPCARECGASVPVDGLRCAKCIRAESTTTRWRCLQGCKAGRVAATPRAASDELWRHDIDYHRAAS